ncbi:DUF368 domain-containing protein [Maribacter aquivivus]|uniref:DUF368 domain-containing protein n=1 Tax=Maribacter aquivivus TaxID=228958 RepID=UPI002491DFE4|nr:DUF368 domain-containing protein [Maribacter aquivivus]
MDNRKLKDYTFISLKGMAMGIAELVPGVSGGTIAFVTGIYEEFITSINNVNLTTLKVLKEEGFKKFWEKLNGNFLLALAIGMMISILTLSKAIAWLLEEHTIVTWAFFFGLVLASVIFVAKSIKRWNVLAIVLFIIGTVSAFYITTLPPSTSSGSLPYIFLSGAVAICAMVMPGISGAFILVLMGSFKTVLGALNEKDFGILITFIFGIIFGILSFARVLKWMFTNYKDATLAILTGFILGSLNKIWPWKYIIEVIKIGKKEIVVDENISPFAFQGDNQLTFAIVAAVIGFSLIFILEKSASKK